MNTPSCAKSVLKALNLVKCCGKWYGQWIHEDVLLQLMCIHAQDCVDVKNITTFRLNLAFGCKSSFSFVNDLRSPNYACVYRNSSRNRIYNNKCNKIQYKKVHYYFFTKQKNNLPRMSSNWCSNALVQLPTTTKPRRSSRLANRPPSPSETQVMEKQRSTHQNSNIICSEDQNETVEYVPVENEKAKLILKQSRWDSPEALSLFVHGTKATRLKKRKRNSNRNESDKNSDIDVKEHVRNQVFLLRKAYLTSEGWRSIVDDNDVGNQCSEYDVFMLQTKAKYLAVTLTQALSQYEQGATLFSICTSAIAKIDDVEFDGFEHPSLIDNEPRCMRVTDPCTIMKWLRIFRVGNCFPNPSGPQYSTKSDLPFIFENNPDLHNSVLEYARANLASLSGEMLHTYLFDIALPETVKKIQEERSKSGINSSFNLRQFLHENHLVSLSPRTVYKWLHRLGFSYSANKKTYYVDSHEKPETVKYRSKFLRRYEAYELRAHRWFQIPLSRYNAMVAKGEVCEKSGYEYKNAQGDNFVELHVDDCLHIEAEINLLQFAGNLSVRKPTGVKPVMILGQDESIFKQYCIPTKSWVYPDGTRVLLPKDEGQGLMISAFVSRELGYGMELTPSQLDAINLKRKNEHYLDTLSAKKKNGNTKKPKLTHSPFSRKLEYGANGEGYWTYECMVLQMEDVVDCLKVIYPDYDFVMLFDHSNGHDRMQPDGLNSGKIGKLYGGKQPHMRDSVIDDDACFGEYHSADYELQHRKTQTMTFHEEDIGPFYLSAIERQKRRYDRKTGKFRTRDILKNKLVEHLIEMGIQKPSGTLKQMQDHCKRLNLPVVIREEIIEEGWVGKPKGAFQILYERGWINPSSWKQYTKDGRKDEMGNLIQKTSIDYLMQQQMDFQSELTLLQHYAKKLGVTVDRTPKCHPELAGEGIEYVWAFAKLFYRNKPLSMKQTKQTFHRLVDECLSRHNLTTAKVRKCSRRAREYMLAYKAFELVQDEYKDQVHSTSNGTTAEKRTRHNKQSGRGVAKQKGTQNDPIDMTFDYNLIQKSIKTYKSHRNARDFDCLFIRSLQVDDVKEDFIKRIVSKMKASN
jgi:hypothetical protein